MTPNGEVFASASSLEGAQSTAAFREAVSDRPIPPERPGSEAPAGRTWAGMMPLGRESLLAQTLDPHTASISVGLRLMRMSIEAVGADD